MTDLDTRKIHFQLPSIPTWKPKRRVRQQTLIASTTMNDNMLSSGLSASTAAAASKIPLKPATDVLAGAFARAASQSTIHPLDTLKVRFQTGRMMTPMTSGGLMKMDVKMLGANVASLYRGIVGAASGAGIAIGAYFAFYGAACNLLSVHTDLPAPAIAFFAGGSAALGSSVVKVPLAVCIRSVQAGVYPNVFNAATSIVKATGPRGLFTGYVPTVLEDVPDMAIKFAAYESMKKLHGQMFNRVASAQEDFAMGAIAGAVAAAATTPLDVIKTNMMCAAASRPSMVSAASLVYAQGGPAAFFRGVGTRAASNGINSAVFFVFFEAIRGAFAARKEQKQLEVEPLTA